MKVPDDMTDRMRASAADVPPQVWAALIGKLLPKVPVSRREPIVRDVELRTGSERQPRGFAGLAEAKKRLPKRVVTSSTLGLSRKGRRKLMQGKDDGPTNNLRLLDRILETIDNEQPSVAMVLRAERGLSYGDITYAHKVGYIWLKNSEGEFL